MAYLHYLYQGLAQSLPSVSYPTIGMLFTMPNSFGKSLNFSLIFHWNMTPAGPIPNAW